MFLNFKNLVFVLIGLISANSLYAMQAEKDKRHNAALLTGAWMSNNHIALGTDAGTVEIINPYTSERHEDIEAFDPEKMYEVSFIQSYDNALVCASRGGMLKMVDSHTGQCSNTYQYFSRIEALILDVQGAVLFADDAGDIHYLDQRSNTFSVLASFDGQVAHNIVPCQADNNIYAIDTVDTINVFDRRMNAAISSVYRGLLAGCAFTKPDEIIIVPDKINKQFIIHDFQDELHYIFKHCSYENQEIKGLASSAYSKYLVLAVGNKALLWNPENNKLGHSADLSEYSYSRVLRFNDDGTKLLALSSDDVDILVLPAE